MKPEVEGEAPFEQPALGRGDVQAGEEPVEGDPLAIAREACAVARGTGLESLLERLAASRYLTLCVLSGGGR